MSKLHNILLSAAILAAPAAALAADATIQWQMPAKNVDGTTIQATGPTAIKTTRIKWSLCKADGAFGTKLGEQDTPAPATSTIIKGLDGGKKYCFQALVINSNGESSTWSNTVSREIPAPPVKPQPPVLSTTINVVFRVVEGQLQIAGMTAIGSLCESRTTMAGGVKLNILPAGSGMTFDGRPIKTRVWSVCA